MWQNAEILSTNWDKLMNGCDKISKFYSTNQDKLVDVTKCRHFSLRTT